MAETGTVSSYEDRTGRGYISPDGGGPEVYVHHASIQMEGFRTLNVGERVSFEVIDDPKGPRAENVIRIGGSDNRPEFPMPPPGGRRRRPPRED